DAASTPLPEWDRLTAEQRELLLAPVRHRWNASPPEKRQHMLEHARRWQSMTPEQREHARHGMRRWHDMPPEQRRQARALFDHIRGLPEGERKAVLERWKTMTAAERKAWVDALPRRDPADCRGVRPAPPRARARRCSPAVRRPSRTPG